MQQLMELYFTYCYNSVFFNNHLLLSEKHLCNNMNFCAGFFDDICSIEIENLKNRIQSAKSKKDSKTLVLFKKALEKRKVNMEENKDKYYSGMFGFLEFNECFQTLMDEVSPDYDRNITNEKYYKILNSNLYFIWNIILDEIYEALFFTDLTADLYTLKCVLRDSAKLNTQKKILLNQAKSGYEVDYSSPAMKKVLTNIESIDF